MKKAMKPVRQGDVLIWPCETIPSTAVLVEPEAGRLIVARGEATGHHHSFPHRSGVTLFRDGTTGPFYVEVKKPVALEHQEHSAKTLERGIGRVTLQRHFAGAVID